MFGGEETVMVFMSCCSYLFIVCVFVCVDPAIGILWLSTQIHLS